MRQGDSPSAAGAMIRLADGRTLGYTEYGNPAGQVLFYFHGHPGSRLEAQLLAEPATAHGLRLIGIDRPGMGLSEYQPRRRLRDWPHDVVQLADRLGIDCFAVAGLSGGGPYALACAHGIGERLTACGIISGVGAISPFVSFLALWLPWLLTPLARHRFRNHEHASRALTRFAHRWVDPDRKILEQPDVGETLIASLVEAFRQGSRGAAFDGMLLGRPWGIPLHQVAFAPLFLWHGGRDANVPIANARKLAEALPHCSPTYYPTDGHVSVIVTHGHEIIAALAPRQGYSRGPADSM
jgi:pimeloyl-ACP methyl ester carboxylesterase